MGCVISILTVAGAAMWIIFSPPLQTGSEIPWPSLLEGTGFSFPGLKSGHEVKIATDIRLMQNLKMRADLLPLGQSLQNAVPG